MNPQRSKVDCRVHWQGNKTTDELKVAAATAASFWE